METKQKEVPTPEEIAERLMEHFDTAVKVAQRIIHSDLENAKDIAMDAINRCYTRLSQTLDLSNVKSYLLTTTHNLSANFLRDRTFLRSLNAPTLQSNFEYGMDLEVADNNQPETIALQNEQMRQIQQALSKLDPERQKLIIYHYLEDLPMDQVAEILKLKTVGAAKSRLHRGMESLRKIITSDPNYSFR